MIPSMPSARGAGLGLASTPASSSTARPGAPGDAGTRWLTAGEFLPAAVPSLSPGGRGAPGVTQPGRRRVLDRARSGPTMTRALSR